MIPCLLNSGLHAGVEAVSGVPATTTIKRSSTNTTTTITASGYATGCAETSNMLLPSSGSRSVPRQQSSGATNATSARPNVPTNSSTSSKKKKDPEHSSSMTRKRGSASEREKRTSVSTTGTGGATGKGAAINKGGDASSAASEASGRNANGQKDGSRQDRSSSPSKTSTKPSYRLSETVQNNVDLARTILNLPSTQKVASNPTDSFGVSKAGGQGGGFGKATPQIPMGSMGAGSEPMEVGVVTHAMHAMPPLNAGVTNKSYVSTAGTAPSSSGSAQEASRSFFPENGEPSHRNLVCEVEATQSLQQTLSSMGTDGGTSNRYYDAEPPRSAGAPAAAAAAASAELAAAHSGLRSSERSRSPPTSIAASAAPVATPNSSAHNTPPVPPRRLVPTSNTSKTTSTTTAKTRTSNTNSAPQSKSSPARPSPTSATPKFPTPPRNTSPSKPPTSTSSSTSTAAKSRDTTTSTSTAHQCQYKEKRDRFSSPGSLSQAGSWGAGTDAMLSPTLPVPFAMQDNDVNQQRISAAQALGIEVTKGTAVRLLFHDHSVQSMDCMQSMQQAQHRAFAQPESGVPPNAATGSVLYTSSAPPVDTVGWEGTGTVLTGASARRSYNVAAGVLGMHHVEDEHKEYEQSAYEEYEYMNEDEEESMHGEYGSWRAGALNGSNVLDTVPEEDTVCSQMESEGMSKSGTGFSQVVYEHNRSPANSEWTLSDGQNQMRSDSVSTIEAHGSTTSTTAGVWGGAWSPSLPPAADSAVEASRVATSAKTAIFTTSGSYRLPSTSLAARGSVGRF